MLIRSSGQLWLKMVGELLGDVLENVVYLFIEIYLYRVNTIQ